MIRLTYEKKNIHTQKITQISIHLKIQILKQQISIFYLIELGKPKDMM